ncbi:prefoldin subunit 4 [Dermacentor silvarum]|uniref:prefoldin subunit 4 n=1 Tax=Dermacentor silvarum TaxID=543639 RepID=UPI0018972117|nr:prefoldin subunit 4 [Dermacentor silvarum]
MAASLRKQTETDVQVTAEDQEMINNFARQNARLEDATEEMKQLEKELRNLEDAADEIMMAEDDVHIPYQLGDVFVSLDSEETQQMIERAKEQNKARNKVLEDETRIIKGIMAELKSQLYNKFGNNINLEADDS